ncbi:hypothetical protein GCM10028807_45210 [Spirosoma daeguense]
MRTCWYAGLLLLTGIFLSACQSGSLDIGQSVINPQQMLIQSVDSVTVQSATVMRSDSFPTWGDADLVVGGWSDPQTGKLTARTFTTLDFNNNPLADQTVFQFDSLVLELGYSFAFGDTTSAFTVNVHRLNKVLPSQVYYNTSSVDYEATPFLQATVIPQPNSRTKQIRLRLPDALSRTFFDKLIKNEISDANTLNNFLTGFAFTGSSRTNAFVGFAAAATGSGLRLYYHNTSGTDVSTSSSSIQFPFGAMHFTQLQRDFTGSPLSGLKNKSDAISSQQTGNSTFVIPGAGIQTRIELPYLNDFPRPDKFADLNSAVLVLGPIRRDFRDNYAPPTQLSLYFGNNQNEILSGVPGGTTGGTQAVSTYVYDPNALTQANYYAFDLTYYIGQIIKRKTSNRSMLLTLPIDANGAAPSLRSLIQRVAIGDRFKANERLQLKLFITSGI